VPTLTHWNGIRPRLEAEGVDVKAAQEHGQLTIIDADELLPRFMRESMPDSPVFLGLAGDVIGQARAGVRYQKVRWWGEMVNVLWERGDVAASMNLEDLFDQLANQHDIAIFCSFLMDNFDGEVHAHMLPRLGTNHSHLIPVDDYARLERAVANALRETVGQDEARVLEIGCSPTIGRPSKCRAPKCYCWHCDRSSRQSLIPCCSGAAGSIPPLEPLHDDPTRYAGWLLDWFARSRWWQRGRKHGCDRFNQHSRYC
jgi:hypothetical protein